MEQIERQSTGSGYKTCVVAVMRHGQRMDCTISIERLKTSFRYNDPPLTDDGCKDAYHKGMLLAAYKF